MARHRAGQPHSYRVATPKRKTTGRLWPLLGAMALGAVLMFVTFCLPLIP